MNEIKNKKEFYLDGLSSIRREPLSFDLPLANFVLKHKKRSTVYHKKRITAEFVSQGKTSLYSSQEDLGKIRSGQSVFSKKLAIDGIFEPKLRAVSFEKLYYIKKREDYLTERLKERYSDSLSYFSDLVRGSVEGMSAARMWNVSIVSSVIFGMFLMTMIYRYLGQGASAVTPVADPVLSGQVQSEQVLAASETDESGIASSSDDQDFAAYISQLIADHQQKIQDGIESDDIESDIREMTKGYPIEKMAPYIARKDRIVAAFLIGIAKKESNWGRRVPVLDGQDCYNYWGYRGIRDRMGTGGHTCFDSPEDAVDTVAKRLEFLVSSKDIDTPDKMVVVWKCGYDCSWDSQEAVNKWISDVAMYFDEFKESID
jgi:hypothetical protein